MWACCRTWVCGHPSATPHNPSSSSSPHPPTLLVTLHHQGALNSWWEVYGLVEPAALWPCASFLPALWQEHLIILSPSALVSGHRSGRLIKVSCVEQELLVSRIHWQSGLLPSAPGKSVLLSLSGTISGAGRGLDRLWKMEKRKRIEGGGEETAVSFYFLCSFLMSWRAVGNPLVIYPWHWWGKVPLSCLHAEFIVIVLHQEDACSAQDLTCS